MSGERILIVDEQPKIARRMARALLQEEEADFQVDVVTSAEQALDRLAESPVHLIVADMRIPGMSGLDLLAEVRKRSPKTRAILTTGFSTPAVEQQARALKVDCYLVKPFAMPDFIQAVKDALPAPEPEPETLANAAYAEAIAKVQARIEALVHDVGAMGALILDPSGQLITEFGQRGDFDTNAFLALVGNTMAAANAVSHMLGDADALDLHFHEGRNYSIYTARINDSVFLSLILPQSTNSRIGLVWLALRRTITDLRVLVSDAAFNNPAPISHEFVDALDDALDIALGPSGGVGPDDSSDPLAGIVPTIPKPAAPQPRAPEPRIPLAPDPPEPRASAEPMDDIDPLAAMMASGELETVDRNKPPVPFERDDSYDPLAGLVPSPLAGLDDLLTSIAPKKKEPPDLSALFAPSTPSTPRKEPPPPVQPPAPTGKPATPPTAKQDGSPLMSTPEPAPADESKSAPKTMPELVDLDNLFNITEDMVDNTPPAPPPAEETKLSYEEAKRLGLIDF